MDNFAPGDTDNPKNWSNTFKWYCTLIVCLTCFTVSFTSTVITPGIDDVAREFQISKEVSLLTISLFIIGFGLGPIIFAPLSEVYGRRIIYATTLFAAVLLLIPCALAPNFATLLVCRALDGIAFSAPMTLVGGTLADLWNKNERGIPMAVFSASPLMGPAIGPLVGGYLSDALGWRWLYWIQLILSGLVVILMTFTVPETYSPVILADRAKKRRQHSNHTIKHGMDPNPLSARLGRILTRPFQLLFTELIVFLLTVYISILYGLLYMFFVAYPIVFRVGKGYTAGQTGLVFIPIAFGVLCSALCAPFVNKHYLYISAKHDHSPPEIRLIPMMLSCWFIPIGMFIFAWTSYPESSLAGPIVGGFLIGFAFIFLYNGANNYLVDSYQHQAASALAANTFLRSFWGAGCVLYTGQMYGALGNQWASSLCCGTGSRGGNFPVYSCYPTISMLRTLLSLGVMDEGIPVLDIRAADRGVTVAP
ncbi:hypothetical protein V492_02596 [Pseudogymnoascus sp. VKM F-4246]|nr:hypothetical protein V492_02596 [Pseudogymnoascus sp. VKM F-4246]